MKRSALSGELLFALMFAVLGLVWMVGSFDLPFWAGFAPDSGFLPLIYGILLFGLSACVAVAAFRHPADTSEREPISKSMQILMALIVAVAACSFIGFVIPLFAMMLFLYAYVEKLPLIRSAIVSAGTTAALAIIFEYLLEVPLPLAPWGT